MSDSMFLHVAYCPITGKTCRANAKYKRNWASLAFLFDKFGALVVGSV